MESRRCRLPSMTLSGDLTIHRSNMYRLFMPAVSARGLVEHDWAAGALDVQRHSRVSGDMGATRLHIHRIK
jgi:hypothetical protein